MSNSRRIVVVCSGNICRSPMGEAIARAMVANHEDAFEVFSVGTLGINGAPADTLAIEVVAELGLDLAPHRSQGVDVHHLHVVQAIVVMSESHAEHVIDMESGAEARIVRLWEHTDEPGRLAEIEDPIGMDRETFLRCRDDIRECLANWLRIFAGE